MKYKTIRVPLPTGGLNLHMCEDCACLVGDRAKHTQWHVRFVRELEAARRDAAGARREASKDPDPRIVGSLLNPHQRY